MAEYWVGEWNTSTDGTIEKDTEYTFQHVRAETFHNPSGQHITTFLDTEGVRTPDATVQRDDWWSEPTNALGVQMITLRTEDGTTVYDTVRSGEARGMFPTVQNAEIMVFVDKTANRPTPDRPSQWDTYWDPYIFTIPLTGDSWKFTCNRDINEGWLILLARD